ncbi:hypothetical protein ACM26V_22020 [Salipaludibacillus sp. HK11]|uniref:hypothetical protein n=1 Tax=Salipaludibacillus sp. HK11 TaxID=3394320 RepID=UPI0039FB9528
MAAIERGEIPVDVYDYLLEKEDLLEAIRVNKRKRNDIMKKVKPIKKSIKAKGHTPLSQVEGVTVMYREG